MKHHIISAALLLLATADLSFGRSIHTYGRDTDLIDNFQKGRDSTSIAANGYLEALNFFKKRVDVPEVPEDPVPEGTPASPGGEPGGNPSVPSDEEPNTESNGGETGPSRPPQGIPAGPALPPGSVPPPATLRPELHLDPPEGLNDDDLAYWNALEESPPALTWDNSQFVLWTALPEGQEEAQILKLMTSLKTIPASNVDLTSSFDTTLWKPAVDTYRAASPPAYKIGGMLSTRLSQWTANSANPVHILYGSRDVPNAPDNSFLAMSELPIVTGPNSLVPAVYRWNADSFQYSIGIGTVPQYDIIWKAGDDPLGVPLLTDLTNDPKATDGDALAASAAAGRTATPADPITPPNPVTPDDPVTPPNPVTPDDPVTPPNPAEPPAGGCVICGLGGCVC